MSAADKRRDFRHQKAPDTGKPGTEDDGGEGTLSGRSREDHPEIPREIDQDASDPDDTSESEMRPSD